MKNYFRHHLWLHIPTYMLPYWLLFNRSWKDWAEFIKILIYYCGSKSQVVILRQFLCNFPSCLRIVFYLHNGLLCCDVVILAIYNKLKTCFGLTRTVGPYHSTCSAVNFWLPTVGCRIIEKFVCYTLKFASFCIKTDRFVFYPS